MDVTSEQSVQAAVQKITSQHGRIDALINNAGVNPTNLPLISGLELSMATNVAGSARVAEACLPFLRQSPAPRLVFLTTVLASLEVQSDPRSETYELDYMAYRCSKAALNMLMLKYAKDLKDDGIKVLGICPGFLATDLAAPADYMRGLGAIEPAEGAVIVRDVVLGLRDSDAGKIVFVGGVYPW